MLYGIIAARNNGNYTIILYKSVKGPYKSTVMDEKTLIKVISNGSLKLYNAYLDNGVLKGIGSLTRFDDSKHPPIVIISVIKAEDKIIGYRVCNAHRKIGAYRKKDLISYCERMVKANGKTPPIQNGVFVSATDDVEAHIRSFPNSEFVEERIERKESPKASVAKVNKEENNSKLSRLQELFTDAQIEQLKLGKKNGVDIRVYGDPKLSAEQMREIRKGLENGIDAAVYASPEYPEDVMRALRINAKFGVNIKYFVNPKLNVDQIFELSTGWLSGVEISKFADPSIPANDMAKIRIDLENQLWRTVEAKEE